MMTASDVARSAILLLERGHTTTDPAVNARGDRCAAWREDAVAWSLVGAVCAVRCDGEDKLRLQLMGRFKIMNDKSMHDYQRQNHTRDETIEALRRCIQA